MKFIDRVHNQAKINSAWFFCSIILGVVCVFLAYGLVKISLSKKRTLVPYSFEINKNIVDINDVDENFENNDYLYLIAEADIKLFTDWTPATVKTQINRFINRFSSSLRKQENIRLKNYALDKTDTTISQRFIINTNPKMKGDLVQVTGIFQQWDGSVLVVDEERSYTIGYKYNGGIPYVVSFKQPLISQNTGRKNEKK